MEHMDALILLAAIAGVPVLLALLFRVSAVFVFVSVAAGSLLVTYLGDDAGLALGMLVRGQNTNLFAQLGLFLLPVVVTLLLLRRTMPTTKLLLHLPAMIANGLAIAAHALPLLDSGIQEKVFANEYGTMLRESQDVVIGAATAFALLIMWLTYRHKEGKHKKHH
jgi:hypothetical protein